jgi:hypothetical protein
VVDRIGSQQAGRITDPVRHPHVEQGAPEPVGLADVWRVQAQVTEPPVLAWPRRATPAGADGRCGLCGKGQMNSGGIRFWAPSGRGTRLPSERAEAVSGRHLEIVGGWVNRIYPRVLIPLAPASI